MMSKHCPIYGIAIYADCLECDDKPCRKENIKKMKPTYKNKDLGIILDNNDCLLSMKNIPNNSIDLIVTDPPYKCHSGGKPQKGKAKVINNIGSPMVHKFNNILGNKSHPTEKPIKLMQYYIENSSNTGDIVLDMFMGTGSTGVACVQSNRKFIGIEIDEEYYKIAKQRILKEKIIK